MGFLDDIKAIGGKKKDETESAWAKAESAFAERDPTSEMASKVKEGQKEPPRQEVPPSSWEHISKSQQPKIKSTADWRDVAYGKETQEAGEATSDIFSAGAGKLGASEEDFFAKTNKAALEAMGGFVKKGKERVKETEENVGEKFETVRAEYMPSKREKELSLQEAYTEIIDPDAASKAELRELIKADQRRRSLVGKTITVGGALGSTTVKLAKKTPGAVGTVLLAPVEGAIKLRQIVGEEKLKFDAAEIGGIPQATEVTRQKMIKQYDEKKGKVIEVPQFDEQGKPVYETVMEPGKIWMPIRGKKGWEDKLVEATPLNVRAAITNKRLKEAELEKSQEGASLLRAQRRNVESVTAVRDYRLGRAAQATTSNFSLVGAMENRGRNYGVRQGYTPSFNVGGVTGSGYIRDRYQVGAIPGVQRTLERNRTGLRDMAARVLSPVSSPITLNPRMRSDMPNVFGGTGIGNANIVDALSVSTGLGGGVALTKLQPKIGSNVAFSGAVRVVPGFGGGLSFSNMRIAGSRVLGSRGRK